MKNKLTIGALALSAFALAACESKVTWDEEGIWKCHNEFNDKSISFDTNASDTSVIIDLTSLSVVGTDIDTGRKFTMKQNDGWVCTLPSGRELALETMPAP